MSDKKKQLVIYTPPVNGIATITLNEPETLNAMSEEMADQFARSVEHLRDCDDVRVLQIRGAGRAFSAGGHLAMLEEKTRQSEERNRSDMLRFYHHFLSVRSVPVPIVAVVHGAAVGAGLCLAMACDFRIVAEGSKLSLNFVKLGLHPGMGATYFLPRLVGVGKSAELLLQGANLDPTEAQRIGLVSSVVPAGELDEKAQALLSRFTAVGPSAVRELVKSIRGKEDAELEACLGREAAAQARDYCGSEFQEGLAAIREKRQPHFVGSSV